MFKFLKNLKFVHKIQFGFVLLGTISALIAVNDMYQINRMKNSKQDLYTDFINPKGNIEELYGEFQKAQFTMLKFSIVEFSSEFNNNINTYNHHKGNIDRILDSLSNEKFSPQITDEFTEIKSIWDNYKNVVADAIISASASGMYDMAAVISTTTGEEVGTQLVTKFDEIVSHLNEKSVQLNDEFFQAESESFIFLIVGMLTGTFVLLLSVFLLAPTISKPIGEFVGIFNEFSLGNFDFEIQSKSQDAIRAINEKGK